jgi:hypothetical protein
LANAPHEKHKEAARVRFIVCRMDEANRLAENSRQAAIENHLDLGHQSQEIGVNLGGLIDVHS